MNDEIQSRSRVGATYGAQVIALRLIAPMLACVTHMALAADPPSCMDRANTQSEMNLCAASDRLKADAELNQVYQAVLERHRDEPIFLDNLKSAHRAWLKWRDAEMSALYPDRDDPAAYGSVFPICW